jgi:hypothetical protein
MAVTYTVTYVDPNGPTKTVIGTFTSAAGDGNGETIATSTHGMTHVVDAEITLDTGGLHAPRPKIAIATGGTVTWTVDDTMALAGRFAIRGR